MVASSGWPHRKVRRGVGDGCLGRARGAPPSPLTEGDAVQLMKTAPPYSEGVPGRVGVGLAARQGGRGMLARVGRPCPAMAGHLDRSFSSPWHQPGARLSTNMLLWMVMLRAMSVSCTAEAASVPEK